MNEDYLRLDVAVDPTAKDVEKAYQKKAKEDHDLISDSFLPMDFMAMGIRNRLDRLNRLMDSEKDTKKCESMSYIERK
jgi:hypothetical protein